MPKKHVVNVNIVNKTGVDFAYAREKFYEGRTAYDVEWPKVIRAGSSVVVQCYEKNWSTVGCSGWVAYSVSGADVFFAFSNPSTGSNGIEVGPQASIWDEMTEHYSPTSRAFALGTGTQSLSVDIQSTGGDVSQATYVVSILD
jgi:hypothetical protein